MTTRIRAVLVAPLVLLAAACGGGGGATTQKGAVAPPTEKKAEQAGEHAAEETAGACSPGRARLAPADGAYFGVSLDWDQDSPAAYTERLGQAPAVYVQFAAFPVDEGARANLDLAVEPIEAAGGMLLLTLEPHGGLDAVTTAAAEGLARLVAGYEAGGVPVFVRFAHEMNGSWYAWSQDPGAYVTAFRTVADALHRLAPEAATVWAPNYGGGYPFTGGEHAAAPGSAAYAALDTDGDGTVTMADDPYEPYWPGDEAVDWVGMSLYHWGTAYPWGENEIPEPGKLTALLTGEFNGLGGDERAVPDFYAAYSEGHGKPMSITETAALYAPGRGGAAEPAVKAAWWQQVTDPALAERFPLVQMVNWFEWDKQESEIGGRVDWTVTRSADLASAFAAEVAGKYRFGGSERCAPEVRG